MQRLVGTLASATATAWLLALAAGAAGLSTEVGIAAVSALGLVVAAIGGTALLNRNSR